MANETDSVFAADQQNGKGELYRLMMSILKEGETDNQETAQQQPTSEVEKANNEPATRQPAAQTVAEPQSVQQPAEQKQEKPEQAEQPKGEVGQPDQTVQGVQADELDDDTKDLLAVKNHNIDDARKYVEKLGKQAQTIMASGMSEGAKRKAQQRYESAAKMLNESIEAHNAEQKAESERLRTEAGRKQAQAKKEHDEKYADINYISDWMDGHKVSEANNTMLASEGFKEGAAAASGKDIFGIAKAAKEYISENTGKLSTAAINDYVNGMLAANRLKEKYGGKFSYNLEPIDSLVLENSGISDSVKKEFVKVRTPKEFGDNNYQTILGNAVDDFVRLFEKEYKREQGKVGKKAMEDYDNIAKNPLADADDKDAARMVYASKVLTGVDLKPMIDRAFNSIPKDRLAALTLALSKDFGYDENKAAEYIANEFQRVCLARTGAKVNSDTEAVIIGGLMNTLVGSFAQASMRSTGGGNKLTLLDAYNASIDERAKEWAKQGMAGYGKIALRSATTMAGDFPAFGGIGKLVGGGTKWSLVRFLPRLSKGVTPKAGEAAFKLFSMTNSGRVVIGVANGAGLGAIYSPVAYSLGSLARGVTPELGEALKSSASGAVDFSMMGFTPSIMNYGADKVLKLFNGTGKAATAIRVATNIAFKDIFGPGANAALVTAKDVLLSSEKISEDLKSYYFEKFGEFLGMHVPGKLSNIRHIADEYKVRTQLNESVFTKEELRSLGYKSVKQMFDDIYAPNGKNSPGYFMKDGKAIASKLYGITVNPKVLESAKMKLLTAIGGGAIATPTITRSEIVSEYGEKGKEVYTVRTYTADGKAFSERDFGSLKDAKLEQTRLGTVIKRNNVAIAEGARDAQWMDTCSERATRTVLSELNGTATEKELTDMLKTAFEKDKNGEQLTAGEKKMLDRFDEVYLQNLRSENADNSSSVRRDFNKSRGVDIDKILAKDYYKWSESERKVVDDYIKELNGENTAKDMSSEQAEPTTTSEPPAESANESPVVEAEKGGQQDVSAPEKEAKKPSEETPSKGDIGIEDYIKINKADDETANDIREDAENYTDEVNALRAESEQAVRYSNGESSEKPEHWDYWKEKFGLEEPKAKTEEDMRPLEEPKADSEPIEPADEKPTEQPKEPKAEEKPVEVETTKEEAKADTKTKVEQAAGAEFVEETEQEQPTVDQLNQYFSHVHLGHELTEKDLGDKARMEMFTKQFLSDKEQAVKYSNGELSEKPEGYAYMKQMFGLKDPVKQPKGEETAYKKGEELVVEHKGSPMTIVVDAVGKSGDVTKSHVKSSGEPYHSNGKVVFTPKEKPQEQAVKDWVDDTASEARLQKTEDYSAFAEQYGLDAEDVAMYAEGMKKGSTSQAMRARAMIGRKIIAAHEGEIHSLMDVRKFRRPVEEALKEKFGDVDKLLEEYRNQVEDEHKAMEAAHKKAQEEEAKRKAHLEELSLLSDDEIDRRYMEALDNGNEVAARDMLDEAARRKGYADTDSEYQGVGAWVAPSNPGYESDEARRADVEDNAPNVNLEDMALGYSLQPDDYFTHPERYSQNTPHGLESARSIQAALEALKRGEKGVKVKVYRAVPISVKESKLRNGDWVTPSKKYAEMHGNSRLEGKYRIIEDEVPANELWWDGNDANEWGYDNGKEYKYKNTKNNRKLNNLVVRDDNGNVIVPSKRFNHRKADERYQIGMEGVKPSKAEVALRDAVIGRLRESGMEVITNEEEGQRVLDEANGRAREMSFGEPYDYEAYPLGRVESNLADKEVMVVTAEADHGFMNYKEAKEWAKKNVSKVYNNEETGGKGDVRISNAAIDKFMSQSAVDKSDSKDVHLSVLKVLPEVLRTSIDVETHPDFLKGKDGKRSAENGMNKDVLVHRCYGAVEIGGKPYRVKITLKEDPRDVSFPHVTHSYEATKIELLAGTWENHEGPSPNTNNSISAAKLLENVEMSYNPSKKVLDASEKRSVGIREQRVWHSSGANFKDAKITDHIRFFRTANGEAYGFTVGGKIYIDPKIATSETPVHEYAHLWASALRSGNPKEWQNVVGLMKGTSVWEDVKKRYSELNTDDEIADEVIATYSGRRGAERLREEAHKVAESNGDVFEKAKAISALGRVKESLKKFWKGVCDFLHIHYKSAEEVADRVMKDLLDGVEPMKIGKGEAGVRFSAKQKRALETAEQSQKTAIATAVSSADGAKVLNNLDTLARNLEKTSSHRKTFIGDIAKAFGVDNRGKSSKYATFETKSGEVVTIRISDHNAKVSNFDTVGEDNGISIVVTRKPNKGITNDGSAHIVEFFYPEISLQRAEGKPLVEIVESIKQALYSGEFKDTTGLAERQEVNGEDVVRYQLSVTGKNTKGGDAGYDSKHTEIEQAVNRELKKNSTSDEIKAEIDRVKKLRAEATKEYLSGKPHSEVAKGDAAALRERLNELNAKKTVAVENERSAKLTDKLADLNSKLIEATENDDAEKVKSLTTEIKRVKTDIGNTGIRSRYKAKISEIKSKSENVSDLAKSLVKYISGELSPILAKEMGKAEFNALVGSVRDIAKQWNAKDGTEQDRNNLATKLDDTIRKVDDVIVGIETRKLIRDLADMLSVKTTKKDSSGKKIGVKVSNTVRIAIETLKGMFRGFDGEFGNGLKSLVKSLDGMLAKKKSLQGRLKELELSEASANERLNSGAITKDEYDAEVEAINRERDDVKSEMANFDTVFSDALSETNDAIDAAVPRTTEEYNKLWNDLMAKQQDEQDEQDGVAQMSAHDKEMLKIMPFVRSLVDVRELFAEADKSQSRLKALEEQWKSDAPTPTDTEMEAANRRDRRLQTALKIREERAKLYAAKDAARKALRDLNNDVRSLLKIGKTQYMAQQQERLEHRSEVAHIGIAAVDTGKKRPAGVKGQQEAKESEDKSVGVLRRLWNWVFLAPTESAESMLSRVDVNHFSGEGELYHLIMESERGYSRSEDRRIESVEGLRSEIQSKCKELFGSKKPKDGNKRIKFTQTLSGEPVPAEVTKGEALSLYLWSLSEEGRAKLESQGIDAFSISEIRAGLGENWVKFGEWVVGDFLPKLYDKYNEKYVEKYGTEITRHENYFPFKIYGGDIVTKDELESFDNGNTIPMPSALKERVKHNYQLSTTEDALKILNEHVAEMEDWYHFADMREDISTLLGSRAFRETLKLQGPNKWRKFRDAMHTLAGVDKRDESVTSQVINEAQSMYASSAVGFRYWTALKQLQSMIAGVNYSYNPRFQARLFANILMPVGTELLAGKVKNAENTFAGMVGSCYWAWKNLPQFRERYRNGKMGNIMLEYESVVGNSNSLYRWIKKNVSQKGLFLNQVFDAAAVAVYSKSIYDYEYKRSIRKGATEEDAHNYAMTCAETNYNKTQQSSGRAYVSKMQVSGNPIEKGLTTFQTASLGFMRKSINDINDIQRAYRLLRLGKEKPLHSISKGAKATVDLLWDGVVMPASWNLINVIGVAGFYYGAKAIFNALFGGDDDNAPTKDATGKTALDRFIEGHAGDVAFATISAPLQGTILNNLVNSAWSGYGGWTPTMAEGAISEVLRSAGETLKGYKDSDSLSGYIEDLDEDTAKYTIKTVLYALFRGYTGIDMKTVERFYNAFYDYKVNGSSLNLISAANFLSTPMSSMRDHEAKDYYLGAYGKTSETAKDLEDYIVKRAYADGKIFKREVESGGARGKVAELFRSRAFKRDLNKYVDEWAEYHIRDASDATDYHDEWLKNHERKEIIRKNRELEYSDEEAKQKTDSLKLALGYEQKSGNSERTLRYNLVHDILRQIKKKLTGGDNDRKEAFALMKELERIDRVKGHTHSDYVKLAEKAGVKDFQMIPKGVSESGKYVNKSDIDNGTVARGEVKGSYGIIATADDVKADARLRKLQDGSEKQKAKAKEVMKMYSDGDISYQDAYRRMTDIGDGLVTAVYASEADRLIKDLKTKLTKAVKAGDDKASDAIMEQIRSIRGKVIDGDMKPKEEVAKMLLNSIE